MVGFVTFSQQRWMRGRSTKGGGSGRRGRESERPGLEDYQAAPIAFPSWTTLAVASLLFVAGLCGCAQNSFQVLGGLQSIELKSPLALEVLLEVDDVAVSWGSGKVGDALKTALVRNGAFTQVHFPIYPSRSVASKLQIVAKGSIETDAGAAAGKSIATGLLLFLPVGVLQYRDVYTIAAEVSVAGEGRKFGAVTVESKVAADHAMFNGPETYALQAQRLALEDLANRISTALAEHPEWFAR